MNCREFRRKHDGYVDDTLSGVEIDAMTRHLRTCAACGRVDTRVRRALLLVHNLPAIEPSAGFGERLQLRIRQERLLRGAQVPGYEATGGRWRPLSRGAYAALAAGVLAAAGTAALATAMTPHTPLRLAPVVASLPEPDPAAPSASLASSAMIAAMPTGGSLWPAVFVAQQAPWHFASDALER